MFATHHKIGVFGSNMVESEEAVRLGQQLGKILAQHQCIVITGACSGMPYIVAEAAHQSGAEIWGFSPARNPDEQHSAYPHDDITLYQRLVYIPQGYDRLF